MVGTFLLKFLFIALMIPVRHSQAPPLPGSHGVGLQGRGAGRRRGGRSRGGAPEQSRVLR